MKLQKLGGYAAIASICVYIFVYTGAILSGFDLNRPMKAMDALPATPTFTYVLWLLLMVSFLLVLVMAFALHEAMKADAPHLTRFILIAASVAATMAIAATVVWVKGSGMIFSTQDISAYRAVQAVTGGLGVAAGHATAWTFLFIGCAILKTHAFSRVLGWFFLLTGISWMPRFIVPQIGYITDPLSCVASIWIGIALLREKQLQPAAREMAVSR